jgi:hypothetical protein
MAKILSAAAFKSRIYELIETKHLWAFFSQTDLVALPHS